MSNENFDITVDGQPATGRPGETLLAVCRRLGKDIPTLCHHESLEPYAACRVCLVEITAGARVALVPACQYPASAGLTVWTDSANVQSARRLVLELLLARCPGSDVVKALAERYGVTSTPFPSDDPNQTCILCGLCVRVCEQLVKASALGFSQRGIDRQVGMPFDESSELCIGCQACLSVCPTGHIRSVDRGAVRSMETWKTDLTMACCEVCGKPMAPEKELEFIRARLPQHVPVTNVCQACRRSQTVEHLSQESLAGQKVKK